MVIEVTFLFDFNALSAIAVTLKLFPPYFTVFGIVTFDFDLSFKPTKDTSDELVTLYLLLPDLNVVPTFAEIVNVVFTLPA